MRVMCWSGPSARETAGAGLAAGAFAKLLLREFGTENRQPTPFKLDMFRLERGRASWEEIKSGERRLGVTVALRRWRYPGKNERRSGCGAESGEYCRRNF